MLDNLINSALKLLLYTLIHTQSNNFITVLEVLTLTSLIES